MPRLGGEDDSRAPPAQAYPSSRRASTWSMVSILVMMLMLRNIFFKDYRQEEIQRLRAAGKSEAEIEALVPKTQAERNQKSREVRTEYEILKLDVARLKTEVHELREIVDAKGLRGADFMERSSGSTAATNDVNGKEGVVKELEKES